MASPEFDKYADTYAELLRDRFSANSDFFHRRKAILIVRYLKRLNFPFETSSWLDVGCGKGELLVAARSSFRTAVGCDPSKEMWRDAPVEIHQQESPTVLPFADSTYDFVTAVCVYHHVEEPDRIPLTREIFRVLRPGGIVCMIEHNPFNPVTRLIVSRTPVDANTHLLTLGNAASYMRRAGFDESGYEYFLYLPEKWYRKAHAVENLLTRLPLGGQYAVFGKNPA